MDALIRKLALALLCSEQGIDQTSYRLLRELLSKSENADIIDAVYAVNGGFYIVNRNGEFNKELEQIYSSTESDT